jgi:hypothetical protein
MVVSAKTCFLLAIGTASVSGKQVFRIPAGTRCDNFCVFETGDASCETGPYTIDETTLITLEQKQCLGDLLIANGSPYYQYDQYNFKKCVRSDETDGICTNGQCISSSTCVGPFACANNEPCKTDGVGFPDGCTAAHNGECPEGTQIICPTENAFSVGTSSLQTFPKTTTSSCDMTFNYGYEQVCKCASDTCDGGGEVLTGYCSDNYRNDASCDSGCNNENCHYDGSDCVSRNYKIGALGQSCFDVCFNTNNPNPTCNEITTDQVGITTDQVGSAMWTHTEDADNQLCYTIAQSADGKAVEFKHINEGGNCGTNNDAEPETKT